MASAPAHAYLEEQDTDEEGDPGAVPLGSAGAEDAHEGREEAEDGALEGDVDGEGRGDQEGATRHHHRERHPQQPAVPVQVTEPDSSGVSTAQADWKSR
ncbi:hypothetical protein OG698_13700 [Streptomyces sp. NBC_01003]|uniref:hypothetical protein n=1 Tax=Streptomyces sp. NBC_01003 TaxID=2903714 RepID=UPI003867BD36|nr:hypothetical protein OG698_13700 [Streptomyces sp. NBC_01003]